MLAGFGRNGARGRERTVEGVGFEGRCGRVGRDGCGGGGEGMAGREDVLVAGAAAFGGDDLGVVRGCDFVDNAYEAFVPVRVLVGRVEQEGRFFRGNGRCRLLCLVGV